MRFVVPPGISALFTQALAIRFWGFRDVDHLSCRGHESTSIAFPCHGLPALYGFDDESASQERFLPRHLVFRLPHETCIHIFLELIGGFNVGIIDEKSLTLGFAGEIFEARQLNIRRKTVGIRRGCLYVTLDDPIPNCALQAEDGVHGAACR